MKSDQGTIIAMSIFVILTILCMVLSYVFYKSSTTYFQQFDTANKKATELETSLRTANADVDSLKQIIGVASTVPVDTIKETHAKYAQSLGANLPGDATVKGYTVLMDQLSAKLDGAQKELASANTAKVALENDYAKLFKDTQDKIKIQEDAAAAAKKTLVEEQEKYTKSLAERGEVKQKLETDYQTIRHDAEVAIKKVQEEKAIANRNVNTISKANDNLTKEIADLRSPVLEREDGKVVSVNQLTGIVVLSIGSASGLRNGTTFAVFDPEQKNLSEAKSKGSIEVSQILGPNKAEARILETMENDPILLGDLIYTPVWKPGMHPRFVLSGRMIVQGFGSRTLDDTTREDDLKDVINLIVANGGIVDYYMKDDGTVMKVNTRIDAQGNIKVLSETPVDLTAVSEDGAVQKREGSVELAQETAFLVIGKGDAMNHMLMANMKTLDDQAKLHGIRSITLPELLRRMGWRNATPSHGYGSRANESDIGPRPTKPMKVSKGTVSPLYSKQADKLAGAKTSPGTVSPMYRTDGPVMRPSSGTVSPLYHQERKPVNASTGNVSGIYGGNN